MSPASATFRTFSQELNEEPEESSTLILAVSCSDQTGLVDQERLQQMDDSLASAQRKVEQHLRPWLREVELQEAAHQRRLSAVNSDIDQILADVENLKDILASVPNDCFNTSPIERP